MVKTIPVLQHYAILINNRSQTKKLATDLVNGSLVNAYEALHKKRGALFSRSEIERYMDEEERHDIKILTSNTKQSLKSMSSGEQKKALLHYILQSNPDFLVLVNPYDNLDVQSCADLKQDLIQISENTILVQLVNRKEDILDLTTNFATFDSGLLKHHPNKKVFDEANRLQEVNFQNTIPPPLNYITIPQRELIKFKNISVGFDGKCVLNNINWTICKNEFWQLSGPNGSGKSTLLTMITGDSHKGYGQDLTLFGIKKGSGESVWDLKEKIGYFTPSMTDKFKGYHTLENMLISGLHDSIGLYVKVGDTEKRLARTWLKLLGLFEKRNLYFHQLSTGEKRMLMTARAMIKHPLLLILDEPTVGLDDRNANLFVALVNKIANESDVAIIFVSHRSEPNLTADYTFQLQMTELGSVGKIL